METPQAWKGWGIFPSTADRGFGGASLSPPAESGAAFSFGTVGGNE